MSVALSAMAIQTSSNTIYLVVNDPVSFAGQPPASVSKFTGQQFSLTVVAIGSGTMSYQWQLDGFSISGATNATLTIPSVSLSDSGSYRCHVSSDTGLNGDSNTCQLTVYESLGITTNPWPQTKTEGDAVSFVVAVSGGTAPYHYQWQINGIDLETATSSELVINPVNLSDAGDYRCVVSDSAVHSVTSNTATLTVLVAETPPPTLSLTHSSGVATYSVTFNAHGAGLASLLADPSALPAGTSYANITGIGIFCELAIAPWTVIETKNISVTTNGDSAVMTFTGVGVDWGNNPTTMNLTANPAVNSTMFLTFNNMVGRVWANIDKIDCQVNGVATTKTGSKYQVQF